MVGLSVMTEGGVTPLGYAPFFLGPFNPHNASHYPGQVRVRWLANPYPNPNPNPNPNLP